MQVRIEAESEGKELPFWLWPIDGSYSLHLLSPVLAQQLLKTEGTRRRNHKAEGAAQENEMECFAMPFYYCGQRFKSSGGKETSFSEFVGPAFEGCHSTSQAAPAA